MKRTTTKRGQISFGAGMLIALALGMMIGVACFLDGCGAASPSIQDCMQKTLLKCNIQKPNDPIGFVACLQQGNGACVTQ